MDGPKGGDVHPHLNPAFAPGYRVLLHGRGTESEKFLVIKECSYTKIGRKCITNMEEEKVKLSAHR